MKNCILLLLVLVTTSFMSAQSLIATTEDGRRVLLKKDGTWEMIDTTPIEEQIKFPKCELPEDYEEPRAEKKIQKFLKMTDATVDDLKKHVAVDNNCPVEAIKVMSLSEQKGNGNYVLCVSGLEMRYRRTGSVFHRQGDSPIGKN